jgi:hypothetical protein
MNTKKLIEAVVAWREAEKEMDLIHLKCNNLSELEADKLLQQKAIDKKLMDVRIEADKCMKVK